MQGVPGLSGTDPVKKMKRLIFFAKHMEIGGLEKALLNLLNSLDLDRYQVTLVLEEKQGAFLKLLDKRIKVEEYRLSACSFVPLRKLLNFTKRWLWVRKNRNRYDFSCSYCTYSVIGSRLSQAASANSCLYVHNDYANIYPDREEFCSFFRQLRTENFRRIVFVSNESCEHFCDILPEFAEKTLVINNLINAGEIKALAAEQCGFQRRPGETVFAFVGRLSEPHKRLSRLLNAFALALKERQDLRLLIVGDGPDRELCREQIGELGLSGQVEMTGASSNPYKYLSRADCLVLSSDYEGFPVVYYEALVLGKDIITTIPVSDEQISIADYGTVTDKTPEALAAAMIAYKKQEHPPFNMEGTNCSRVETLYALAEGKE